MKKKKVMHIFIKCIECKNSPQVLVPENLALNSLGLCFSLSFRRKTTNHWKTVRVFLKNHASLAFKYQE